MHSTSRVWWGATVGARRQNDLVSFVCKAGMGKAWLPAAPKAVSVTSRCCCYCWQPNGAAGNERWQLYKSAPPLLAFLLPLEGKEMQTTRYCGMKWCSVEQLLMNFTAKWGVGGLCAGCWISARHSLSASAFQYVKLTYCSALQEPLYIYFI